MALNPQQRWASWIEARTHIYIDPSDVFADDLRGLAKAIRPPSRAKSQVETNHSERDPHLSC